MTYSMRLTAYHPLLPQRVAKTTTLQAGSLEEVISSIQNFCEIDPEKNFWDGKLVTALVLGGFQGYSHFQLKRKDALCFTATITPSFFSDKIFPEQLFPKTDLIPEKTLCYTYWSQDGKQHETRVLARRVLLLPHRIQALALYYAESFLSISSSFQSSSIFSEFPKQEFTKTQINN